LWCCSCATSYWSVEETTRVKTTVLNQVDISININITQRYLQKLKTRESAESLAWNVAQRCRCERAVIHQS
jgi:hypothetical protein